MVWNCRYIFSIIHVFLRKKNHHYRLVVDLDESRDIQNMQNMILNHVRSASIEALGYMNTFAKYEYIWLEDKQSYLKRFLNECEQKCCLEDNDFPEDNMHDPNAEVDLFQAQVCVQVCVLAWRLN